MISKSFYNNIQQTLSKDNINVVVGNIYDFMSIWKQWWRGNVNDFHYYNAIRPDGTSCKVERKTLGMPKKLCEDFSGLLWSRRATITLDNKENTKKLWKVLDSKENGFSVNFPQFLEKEYMYGTMVTVEYKKDNKTIIDYIDGDVVLPYKYTNSYIYGIITVSRTIKEKADGNKEYRTLLTYHEFDNNKYITNHELYFSDNENSLGNRADFRKCFPDVKEYDIIETEYPRFQVWKLPIANNLDTNSPMGISILANHIDKFKAIDTKYDTFDYEFISGKRRILIDRNAVKKKATGVDKNNNIVYTSYFDNNDLVYVAIEGMENQPVKDINFDLRADAYINSINAELNYLGAGAKLGNNFYSFDKTGLKTATEVISENSDTFRTKEQHQIPIYDCLYDLVACICEMENIPYKEITITFDDSIVQDEGSLITRGMELYKAKLISKEKFMSKYLHYEEQDIIDEIKKIENENKIIKPEGIDFFGTDGTKEDETKELLKE